MTKPEILVWFYKINSYQPYIAIMMIIQKHPPLQEIETHWIQTSRPLQSHPPPTLPHNPTLPKPILFKPNKICLLDIFNLILQWNARAWTFYYKNTSINLRGGRGTARSIYQQTYSGPGTHWILELLLHRHHMCCTKSTAHLHSKYLPFTINNLNNKIIMPRNCWKKYVHALSVNQRVPVRVNTAILLTECHMISYCA